LASSSFAQANKSTTTESTPEDGWAPLLSLLEKPGHSLSLVAEKESHPCRMPRPHLLGSVKDSLLGQIEKKPGLARVSQGNIEVHHDGGFMRVPFFTH